MKLRQIFIILFVILSTNVLFAQKGGIISVGVTPGLGYMLAQNTYFLQGNAKELDYKPKFSYHVFVQGGYNFREQHGVVGFVNYCEEGQKYQDKFAWKKYPATIGTHYKTVDFKYVGFGALYRFAPVLPGQKEHIRDEDYHWRMKLLIGFEVDVLLKANIEYRVDKDDAGTLYDYGYPLDATLGGYPGYSPNPTDDYKSFYKPIQGVGVLRYGFDYVFNNNMYLGCAIEAKIGLNDINADAYKKHDKYKKSRNYFFGLNVEVGYTMNKYRDEINPNRKKKAPKSDYKVKHKGPDKNREVDLVDKKTQKRIKKGLK